MKKFVLLPIISFAFVVCAAAQTGAFVKLATSSKGELSLTAAPVPQATVTIDWGDGVSDKGTANWDNTRVTFTGKAKGAKIVLSGAVKEIDFSSDAATLNEITSVEFEEQGKLEQINLKGNKIKELRLQGFPVLTNLDVRDNELTSLDIAGLPELVYLTATNNKLVQIHTGENNKLEQAELSNNNISALSFPSVLPKLSLLNIENNAVLTIDPAKVPALEELNINGNAFRTIDIAGLSRLSKLFAAGNYLTAVALSANRELQSLDLSGNRLQKIDLAQNTKLTRVNLAGNMLQAVDPAKLPILLDLNVRKNEQLYHVDLSQNTKLRTINADSTAIEGLDLNMNINVSRVYLRGTRLSPYAFNYLFETLPDLSRNPTGYVNIYLSHTSWKGADLSILAAKHWKSDLAPDVDGGPLVPREDATVDMKVDANGSVSAFAGGEEVVFPKTLPKGAVVHLEITPAEGYELDCIKREVKGSDGKPALLPVYGCGVIIEDNTVIRVAFRKRDARIVTLVTNKPQGTNVSLKLRQTADAPSENVLIDWGNGQWVEQAVTKEASSTTVADGTILGSPVRILGAIDKIGADEMGITKADLTQNPSLIVVDLYGNELTEIDLTKNPALANLGIGFNKLKRIDLSANKQLEILSIRGNEEISELDLRENKILVRLDAKNLRLSTIALTSPDLAEVDLQGNQLTSVDFSAATKIEELRIGNNRIQTVDLSALGALKLFNAGNNLLSAINLEKNLLLERLYVNDNPLKKLRFLPTQTKLIYINMADCALDACQLDSTYASLPLWKGTPNQTVPVTLFNQGLSEKANAAGLSKTNIAEGKGWTLTARGDGSGCANDLFAAEALAPGKGFNYYDAGGVLYIVIAPEVEVGAVRLYDLSGKLVYSAHGSSQYGISLPAGKYILHLAGRSFTVAVR